MPGITWDAEADRKILLALLKDPELSANVDWDALAAELSTETVTCTVGALKKRISRMKIAAKVDNDEGSDGASPKTPALKKGKAKANGTAGSSAGPKSKGKGKAATKRKVSDDSEDEDEGTPLTKKTQKVAPGQEELKAKTEDNDDDEA
ncbi:hypothetical protein E4T52_16876 [Aureobasidium sp. EXF-3400]|nr:hypothetical protein E4T51_16141 [Aureobasidium sp. EXF-12344]KAI4768019.1 hypothetical protein E4T52_16876 [Aureobasidium sp. EXF-3400]